MCFKERNSKVCGNSRVEEGEECDPGLLHLNDDPCCSSGCKFKHGAQCRYDVQKTFSKKMYKNKAIKSKYTLKHRLNTTWWIRKSLLLMRVEHRFSCSCSLHSDRNSPCCSDCKFQQAGVRCQEPISATCKGTSSCTGERHLLVYYKNCTVDVGHIFIWINEKSCGKLSFLTVPSRLRQQQWVSTSWKCRRRHSVCWQRPVSQRRVQPFLWGHAEPSVLCLQW